jgi:hypothetical protein
MAVALLILGVLLLVGSVVVARLNITGRIDTGDLGGGMLLAGAALSIFAMGGLLL